MTTPELTLSQKAFRTKILYRFFDGYVEYTITDSRGDKASFSVKYEDLPSKFDYRVYQPRKPTVSIQFFILMLITLFLLLLYPMQPLEVLGFMACYGAFTIGLSTLLRRKFFKKIYTSIPTRNGKLLVLRNKTYAEVMDALKSRRLRALRRFAMIDTLNTPQAEMKKLRWLQDEGAITAEEFDNFRRALGPAGASVMVAPPVEAAAPQLMHQGAFRFSADFRFHDAHLEYAMNDGAETGFNVRYNDLPHPTQYRTFFRKDSFVGGVFMLGIVLGVALLNRRGTGAYYVGPEGLEHLLQTLAIYVPCLAGAVLLAHRFTKKEFTIVPVTQGAIRVLHDSDREKIMDELQSRRQSTLRAMAVIDVRNAPQGELKKFQWLKEQGAITDQEFEAFRARLLEAISNQPGAPSTQPPKPPTETLH